LFRISFILLLGIALFSSCKDTPSRPEAILEEGYEPSVPTSTTAVGDPNAMSTPAAPTAEPPQNAAGVWHYTCPAGCAGGGGSATPCSSCGQTLVHNTAYHDNNGGGATTTVTPGSTPGSITSPIVSGGTQQAVGIPPAGQPGQTTPEPPQNAAGVWHYICEAGCAGGGGSATACAGCGSTLVHNTAYHN